jgi:hypothetical protein
MQFELKKTITTSNIGFEELDEQIFVFEHLTNENYDLFKMAKDFKRKKLVEFVWVRNGRVLVRKNESSPAVLIKSVEDLNQFMARN